MDEQRRWDDLMTDHEKRMHHPAMSEMFPGVDPDEVVRNVVSMSVAVPGLLDVVFGPPKVDPVTGNPMRFSDGSVIREEERGLRHQLQNGGLKTTVKLTKPQWAAAITAIGAVFAALIQGLLS